MKSLRISMPFEHRQTFNKKHTMTIKKYNAINLQEKVVNTRIRIRYLYYVVVFSSKSADLKLLFSLWHSLKKKGLFLTLHIMICIPERITKCQHKIKKKFLRKRCSI